MMILEILRAIIGFLLVLFIPGYAFTWALFPKKDEIDIIERIALSIGLSISTVVLSIFVLNIFFKIRINLINSLLTILILTFIFSAIGYYRMNRLSAGSGEIKKT